jgi:hypothetical protein
VGGLLTGVALLGLAGWLIRFDLAWRAIRHPGLPRFMAVCLLSGYVWLTTAALLVIAKWPQTSGVVYDAVLQAFFVSFVFSMIFGHAPVIFPVVLGLPVHFRWTSYPPGPPGRRRASLIISSTNGSSIAIRIAEFLVVGEAIAISFTWFGFAGYCERLSLTACSTPRW